MKLVLKRDIHTKVSGDTLLTVSAMDFGSDKTPVEVSTWVKVTTLYFFDWRALSTSAGDTAAPICALIWSTFAPYTRRLGIWQVSG
jgi:hypothetical protein